MNWITKKISEFKSKAKKIFKQQEKIDPSSSLWETCPSCSNINYKDTLVKQDWTCNNCSYYFDKPPLATVKTWFENKEIFIEPPKGFDEDPLNFKTELGSYRDKLAKARKKEKQWCSILGYKGFTENLKVHLVVSNFKFLGGSWGHLESIYFQKIVSDAIENQSDVFVLVLKTGGVSMFTGALGLNSVMGAGTIGMQQLKKNNILTVGVAQSKTTGGVLASVLYNSEIVILEKGAHDVTFAGKRISKNYLASGEVMDQKFGTAEEKITKGMCDLVLDRSKLKPTICTLAKIIKKKEDRAVINETQHDSTNETSGEILPKTAEKI
tara:strand:- start:2553 stop:3524 length:972 start_codon:yes stop_codon:yes gene_type:complete